MNGEVDRGPFASMDPWLERAVSAYGTPPIRKTVSVMVREIDSYSFEELPTNIDGWIEWLNKALDETPEQHRASLSCVLKYEDDYDSPGKPSFEIWYDRPETDVEMIERLAKRLYEHQDYACIDAGMPTPDVARSPWAEVRPRIRLMWLSQARAALVEIHRAMIEETYK